MKEVKAAAIETARESLGLIGGAISKAKERLENSPPPIPKRQTPTPCYFSPSKMLAIFILCWVVYFIINGSGMLLSGQQDEYKDLADELSRESAARSELTRQELNKYSKPPSSND